MAGVSTYLGNALLDHILKNTAYSSPAAVYAALYLSDPTISDLGEEVKGGSYARQSISVGSAASLATSNDATVTFPAATADWGTITHLGIKDALGPDVVIEDCEDAWAESVDSDVTSEVDAADYKKGAGAVKLTVDTGASAGDILATEAIGSTNLTAASAISLWIKSSVDTASGDLQLLLDDTASCASPLKSLDIPALTGNTWTRVNLPIGDASGLTAIISIGLKYVTDLGACIIRLDDVTAVKGNLLLFKALNESKTVNNGDQIKFLAGDIDISIS